MQKLPGSRRNFLAGTVSVAAGSWLASHAGLVKAAAAVASAAMENGANWVNLSAEEAANLAAVADQVFPADDTPGASQLGAVHFMDAALGGFMAGLLPLFRQGVANLDERAAPHPFHRLGFDQQTEIIRQIESTAFFGNVHFLTLVSLFALPSYGGNTQGEAWKMIGFEPRHVWLPPFGYYDAEYAQESNHASS